MVGFLGDPAIEEELDQQSSELKKLDDPLPVELSFYERDDFSLSFADSLLDFDCIRDWMEEAPVLDMADSNPESEQVSVKMSEVKAVEACFRMEKDGSFGDGFQDFGNCNTLIEGNPVLDMVDLNPNSQQVASVEVEVKDVEGRVGMEKDGSCRGTGVGDGFQKFGDLSYSIEEEIGKFSLDGGSEESSKKSPGISGANSSESVEAANVSESGVKSGETVTVNRDGPKSEKSESGGDVSDSNSDADGSARSTSPSSSSSEEEEVIENEKGKVLEGEIDMEEGEIRDSEVEQMVGWSDDEDEEGPVTKGPIRSKNEVQVLPPVPPVEATLQPHHQTLPVGVILSIIGTQVIVEGIEKHNPLSDGSILWITESRLPLGLVDEIFGPVKNPYYMIRYNSENDIPSCIKQGTPISFVSEFANHVLNDTNLYKKGYDASGENDEEVTDEAAEFSDDEREAEYKRMIKMAKRGTNGPNLENKKKERKKFSNRGGTGGRWQQNCRPSTPQRVDGAHQSPINQNQQLMFNNQNQQFMLNNQNQQFTHDQGSSSSSFGTGQGFTGNPPFHFPGFIPPSSGVWTNGMPCEQQSIGFPFGVPTNGMPWLQQNQPQQQSYQMPFPNGMLFQQQFNPGQMLPPNLGAQSNFGSGPTFAPWPGSLGQSGLNQSLGMGWQPQQAPIPINVGEQSRPLISGNVEVPQEFNQGVSRGRGRKPFHRGGGHFGGGRGRGQSK